MKRTFPTPVSSGEWAALGFYRDGARSAHRRDRLTDFRPGNSRQRTATGDRGWQSTARGDRVGRGRQEVTGDGRGRQMMVEDDRRRQMTTGDDRA